MYFKREELEEMLKDAKYSLKRFDDSSDPLIKKYLNLMRHLIRSVLVLSDELRSVGFNTSHIEHPGDRCLIYCIEGNIEAAERILKEWEVMVLTKEELDEMLKIAKYSSKSFKFNNDLLLHHNTYITLIESVIGLREYLHKIADSYKNYIESVEEASKSLVETDDCYVKFRHRSDLVEIINKNIATAREALEKYGVQ